MQVQNAELSDESVDVNDESDGSESDQSQALEIAISDSSETEVEEDFMTDDGEEAEVEHASHIIKWQQSKVWQKEVEDDDFVHECGEAEWKAPAKREDVPSLETGPEQVCTFDVDITLSPVELLFDALPLSFWKKLAKMSLKYAVDQGAFGAGGTRYCKREWFTASNYVRVFAAMLMRGLVTCRANAEFFRGVTHGKYSQTGAELVLGLSLNKYQQLLRYMHFVDNKDQKDPSSDDFDKLFKVRPLIRQLQKTFIRWCQPGKNNCTDEAGFSSRSRWMRTFNPQIFHRNNYGMWFTDAFLLGLLCNRVGHEKDKEPPS